jgi:hypothetical protein
VIRLLAAVLAPLVVIAGLLLGFPEEAGKRLDAVSSLRELSPVDDPATDSVPAPAALGPALERTTAVTERRGALTSRTTTSRLATAEGDEPEALPLGVTMGSLAPAVVPKRGPVVVRGRVVNRTDETWSDINVYACSSGAPLTTPSELALAVQATTDDVVCGRTHVFVTIDSLGPGESAPYRLRVARDQLEIGTTPGAYWFGVQALGTSSEGRDALADGTVRTFLPLVGERVPGTPTPQADLTVVVPIRARTLHTSAGRLASVDTWERELAPGGRLANLLTLAEDAPYGGASLLVDPAVIVAAQQLAAGNPERGLGAPVGDPAEEPPTEEEPDASPEDPGTEEPTGNADAVAWLERFTALAQRLPVLALPYGDLDVAGAAHHDRRALTLARAESEAVLDALGVSSTPALVPPTGVVPAALRELAAGATVIASSAVLGEELATAAEVPAAVTVGGDVVRIAEAGLGSGGPGPTAGTRSLALRQRLLAEGLVRSRTDRTDPTLVVLPHDANPGPSAGGFFDELDRPFVRTTGSLPSTSGAVELDELLYPASQRRREVTEEAFADADRLIELGDTLDRLLTRNDGIDSAARREALSGTSYFARDSSLAADDLVGAASASVQGAASWFEQRLARVDVAVPRFVILGSTEGPFAMTVTNDLERPVQLGIRAATSEGLAIRAPKSIDVPAQSSRTVNLVARTSQPGVHSLVLVVTDKDGRPVRKSQDISIRSRDVGWVIWLIMGGGATLLAMAIVLRWRSRLRASRSLPQEAP